MNLIALIGKPNFKSMVIIKRPKVQMQVLI
jgi:hypothetical protein